MAISMKFLNSNPVCREWLFGSDMKGRSRTALVPESSGAPGKFRKSGLGVEACEIEARYEPWPKLLVVGYTGST